MEEMINVEIIKALLGVLGQIQGLYHALDAIFIMNVFGDLEIIGKIITGLRVSR